MVSNYATEFFLFLKPLSFPPDTVPVIPGHSQPPDRGALLPGQLVKELPQKMYRISSATENIIMEVPQKIPISAFSATLAYIGIPITIFFKAPASECIFYNT